MKDLKERKIKVVVSERVSEDLWTRVMVKHYTLKQSQTMSIRADDFTTAVLALLNASGDYPEEKRDEAYEVMWALTYSASIIEIGANIIDEDDENVYIDWVLKDAAHLFKWALDRGNEFSIYVMMDE